LLHIFVTEMKTQFVTLLWFLNFTLCALFLLASISNVQATGAVKDWEDCIYHTLLFPW